MVEALVWALSFRADVGGLEARKTLAFSSGFEGFKGFICLFFCRFRPGRA